MPDASNTYDTELSAIDAIRSELEEARREFAAGNPIAARMHLWDALGRTRAVYDGESV